MMHHEMAKSVDEICAEYGLGLAEVHAALAYYFDHRAEVDKCIKESRDLVVKLRNTTPSQVKERLQGQPRG